MGSVTALEKVKAHYGGLKDAASLKAAQALRPYGIVVNIRRFSRSAHEYVADNWNKAGRDPAAAWDWDAIARKYREPKALDMAMWTPDDRLAGLALSTMTTEAATLRFVEGDPSADCTLKGKRALIALEVTTNYAQAAGLKELRIEPLNEALGNLYEKVYGFELVTNRKAPPYYRKAI